MNGKSYTRWEDSNKGRFNKDFESGAMEDFKTEIQTVYLLNTNIKAEESTDLCIVLKRATYQQ